MAEKKKSFEASMSRVEEIVRALEQGDAALEESIALFEEGTKLIRGCTGMLDKAEQRVKKLLLAEDGTAVEAPFTEE